MKDADSALKRARDALIPGTEPYAALVLLIDARIEEIRDDLETATASVPRLQGGIHELRALVDALKVRTVRAGTSPPTDY